MGSFTAMPGPGPGPQPDDPAPPNGPNLAATAAVAGTPTPAQPMVDANGVWLVAAASVNVVAERGPGGVGGPASAPATISIPRGPPAAPQAAAPVDRSGTEAPPAEPPAEAAAPRAAGVLTAFMPIDPGAVEASLTKLLNRIDALGEPIPGTSERLPIVVPVAAALAAMEAARRRLTRPSTPGAVIGRGLRFSSLRRPS